ncbi:MAG: hypothetical protein A3B37_01815 [Candidatus Sungbacteria bacterium RIFCSPLOWO2_01_FULL_59_16]|uniref:Gfo/Idh/MocA family oxidoreductase n=1 Tax=Candidatus Sungbacteria bacterium RIFCSPLOWO2_01_FULL_59_16 TaxID=1802280 RepID=A0A1G2LCR0_9BACT|nr:MAG: hypothetical protein A3B37_01815 [Candidatus Sungbacteria bacterium RIFCSPLOWO2_01_FULL_59_16]
MKFLVVGTGSIGRRHFGNLRALGYRDIAVVRSKRRMDAPQREFFRKYQPRVFYDLGAALAEKPDAVFVCNPTSLHMPTARRAIRAGSHVFIEKPVSHSRAGIDQLLREARKRRRIIYVGYHSRHHPLLKTAKRFLDSGKLGKLHSARFVTGEYLPGWHPWEDHRRGYAARRDLGGGVVLTQSHDLDLIYWFFGKPRSVTAVVRNSGTLGIDADDIAAITFSTPRCPVVVSYLDYLSRPPVKQFTISGDRGHLEWRSYANELHLIAANGKIRIMKTPRDFERNDMYVAEAKDFIRCIRQGRRPAVDGEAGRTVLEMAIAAKEASRRQRAVRLL